MLARGLRDFFADDFLAKMSDLGGNSDRVHLTAKQQKVLEFCDEMTRTAREIIDMVVSNIIRRYWSIKLHIANGMIMPSSQLGISKGPLQIILKLLFLKFFEHLAHFYVFLMSKRVFALVSQSKSRKFPSTGTRRTLTQVCCFAAYLGLSLPAFQPVLGR